MRLNFDDNKTPYHRSSMRSTAYIYKLILKASTTAPAENTPLLTVAHQ